MPLSLPGSSGYQATVAPGVHDDNPVEEVHSQVVEDEVLRLALEAYRESELAPAATPWSKITAASPVILDREFAIRRFERVTGAITMLPSVYLRAGIVQAFSAPVAGIVDVGRYPCGDSAVVAAVAADLRRAGFHSEVRSDILRWQYGKLLDNLKNVLQALCGPTADYGDLVTELRVEAEICYRAAGIAYASESELRSRSKGVLNLGTIDGLTRPGDSSWQSLARATGSIETDFLNGEIAMLGRVHGIPTPLNARLQELANQYSRERRLPGSLRIEDLHQLLSRRHESSS